MRLAIFFGCLFYLLLGGYNYYYTAIHHNGSCYSPVQNIEKTVVKEIRSDQEAACLIAEEAEEDDTESLFARKYKLLTGSYLTDAGHLRYLYGCSKPPLISCSTLSDKYIIQRALRI